MKKILSYQALLWAILAGLAYVLCFPKWDLPYFSVFFLFSAIVSIHKLKTNKEAVALGFLLSAMVAWGGFAWIVYVGQNFGNLPLPVAIFLEFLFCVVAGPQMVAFFILAFRFRYQVEKLYLPLRPLFWAMLYTGLEFIARFIKIFPEHLGNTLLANLSIAQAASLGGVSLLSFIPLWIGASAAYLRISGQKALPCFLASILFAIGIGFWGQNELKNVRALPFESLKIGFVQHNLQDIEKLAVMSGSANAIGSIISGLIVKTATLVKENKNIDLLLWPETAYPIQFPTVEDRSSSFYAHGYANLVRDMIKGLGIPLLFGGYESKGSEDFNSGILLNTSGRVESTYRKVKLLLFGEYIPFAKQFPMIKKLNPQMGDFDRGPGAVPVEWSSRFGKIPLGVNICYEAIMPEYMREFAKNGAQIFVNLTKDSWFGDTFEPYQHFQLSALRSIENRIPLVRITNSGLSGVVFPSGEFITISPPFREALTVLDVPYYKKIPQTLYTRWGEWFAWACVLISTLTLWRFSFRK